MTGAIGVWKTTVMDIPDHTVLSVNDTPQDGGPAPLLLLSDLRERFAADLAARHDARAGGRPLGPLVGLGQIDRAIGGALLPGLHFLHGSPGSGKTAFALQAAASCQCPALFVSCEMSPLELVRRIAARVTGEYLGRFKSGEIPPAKGLALFDRAAAAAPLLGLLDATARPVPPGDLYRRAADLRASLGGEHVLIVVDSLHSWAESALPVENEYEALNTAVSKLREIAGRLNCPVLAIAERNRAAMKAGGQSAGAGTRKIEYASESVIELDRSPEAVPDANDSVEVKLTLSKNRNGATTAGLRLRFRGACQEFTEAA